MISFPSPRSRAFQGRPASPPSRPRPSRAAVAWVGTPAWLGFLRSPPHWRGRGETGGRGEPANCSRSARSVFRQGQAYPLFGRDASKCFLCSPPSHSHRLWLRQVGCSILGPPGPLSLLQRLCGRECGALTGSRSFPAAFLICTALALNPYWD